MKKLLCLLLSLSFLLCACGPKAPDPSASKDDPPQTANQSDEESKTQDDDLGLASIGDVDVDAGLFNVTITVPADFLDEGVTQENLDEQAKEKGFKSITLNDDGSATYVMTKAQHEEMMDEIRQSIDGSLLEMASSEDYPSVVSIDANEDYTEYKITVNAEEVGLQESFLVLSLYVFGGMYHVFNGTEPGNINVQYVNETTGAVIQEANSDDMG